MSPLVQNLDTVDSEHEPRLSDMRRVSLSLAFNPARDRRRKQMNSVNSWLHRRLGISYRRGARTY